VLSKQTTEVDTRADSQAKATPGELPFTGFPIWVVEAFGVLLLAGGLVILRLAR
jgi:hypothetical protein